MRPGVLIEEFKEEGLSLQAVKIGGVVQIFFQDGNGKWKPYRHLDSRMSTLISRLYKKIECLEEEIVRLDNDLEFVHSLLGDPEATIRKGR